jgi:hypothetical protein
MAAPIALTDNQLTEVITVGRQIPPALRGQYLQKIADLLRGRDFGDGDVYRACIAAQREILWPSRPDIAIGDAAAASAP